MLFNRELLSYMEINYILFDTNVVITVMFVGRSLMYYKRSVDKH